MSVFSFYLPVFGKSRLPVRGLASSVIMRSSFSLSEVYERIILTNHGAGGGFVGIRVGKQNIKANLSLDKRKQFLDNVFRNPRITNEMT